MTIEAPIKAITHIHAEGFRSIKSVTLNPGRITVLIGPNGSGKSNLLSFLRMIPLLRTQSLRTFVGEAGGASALLHYGPKTTREIGVRVEFEQDAGANAYCARLGYAAGDSLIFLDETVGYRRQNVTEFRLNSLGAGHAESLLEEAAKDSKNTTARTVRWWLSRMNFYHFHDTSGRSALRQNAHPAGSHFLRSDGSNLAAYLYRLANSEAADDISAWKRVGLLLQQIAPYVKQLEPALVNPNSPEKSWLRLFWFDERDHRFDVSDFSDGTLRALALITALSQPAESLPAFICIDEPELGLHPAAITLLVGLVRSVAPRCQVLLATQSPALLDHFEPEEVVVAERERGGTVFHCLDPAKLAVWRDDYSLSQLYDKNILGGRP